MNADTQAQGLMVYLVQLDKGVWFLQYTVSYLVRI